ncbi:MAG: hypothetical protein C7B46_17770 [Sulfobacillus benefaciens]|uniref:Uncharacterized protein n=1 Tax=Sulfobacillus benefaciens TaxID=453960 RepID=A0A2T2X851_9FIRM|nr:MAG: hypothetical protein C7B46_17770 [Sulfobacillus benefaciens]
MIVAESNCDGKNYRAIMEWAQTEGPRIAEEVVQRLPPAVRQAMTSLDEIETGILKYEDGDPARPLTVNIIGTEQLRPHASDRILRETPVNVFRIQPSI